MSSKKKGRETPREAQIRQKQEVETLNAAKARRRERVEYKVVSGNSREDLKANVHAAIGGGWRLQGGMTREGDEREQAMFRTAADKAAARDAMVGEENVLWTAGPLLTNSSRNLPQDLKDRPIDIVPQLKDKALLDAAKRGQLDTCQELIGKGHGADHVEEIDKDGRTPLLWACDKGHTDVVKLLLEHNAEMDAPDSWGNTAAHNAAVSGRCDALKVLMAAGADLTIANKEGHTALDLAVEQGKEECVAVLSIVQ